MIAAIRVPNQPGVEALGDAGGLLILRDISVCSYRSFREIVTSSQQVSYARIEHSISLVPRLFAPAAVGSVRNLTSAMTVPRYAKLYVQLVQIAALQDELRTTHLAPTVLSPAARVTCFPAPTTPSRRLLVIQ